MKKIKAGEATLEIDNILYTVTGIKVIVNSNEVEKVQGFFKNNNLSTIELYENDTLSATYNDYSEFESLSYEQTSNSNIITIYLNKLDKLAVQMTKVSDTMKVLSTKVAEAEKDVSTIENTLEELLLLIASKKETEGE